MLRQHYSRTFVSSAFILAVLFSGTTALAYGELYAPTSRMAAACVPDSQTIADGMYEVLNASVIRFKADKTGQIRIHCPIDTPPLLGSDFEGAVIANFTVYFIDPDANGTASSMTFMMRRFDQAYGEIPVIGSLFSASANKSYYTSLTKHVSLLIYGDSFYNAYYIEVTMRRTTTSYNPVFYGYSVVTF